MPSRLKDHLNSHYFEAANQMTSKKARRRIVAYVESYDDIYFWRTVLSRVENDQRYFEVMLPSKEKLKRGKKSVLMNFLTGEGSEERVGPDMIACVDADYDYLMQGATEQSKRVLENPYVFHTYVYAIENFQCYAPSLHDVCVAVTLNDHAVFDFAEFMRQYSLAIFPLFVWSIWYYRTPDYNEFSLTEFSRVIDIGSFSLEHAEKVIQHVRHKVDTRVRQLQQKNPGAKESYLAVKEDIKRLGVTAETTYMYVQGHHLFDKVVVPMLKKVCTLLIREREVEITRQSVHGAQRRNELSCYTKSLEDIPSMLRKNVSYVHSQPFKRILADVEQLLNRK